MYASFDYRCPSCKAEDSRFVKKVEQHQQRCKECDYSGHMVKLPSGTRTTFRFADAKLKG